MSALIIWLFLWSIFCHSEKELNFVNNDVFSNINSWRNGFIWKNAIIVRQIMYYKIKEKPAEIWRKVFQQLLTMTCNAVNAVKSLMVTTAYFLTKSAKYEWERYQRYNRIREMRVQRNSPDIAQNENERNWTTIRLFQYYSACCRFYSLPFLLLDSPVLQILIAAIDSNVCFNC